MKKITIGLVLSVLLSGCMTISPIFKMSKGALDFRSYTENGFFIAPGGESGNLTYNPIGLVSISFTPGVIAKEGEKAPKQAYQEQRTDPMGYSTEPKSQLQKTNDNFFRPTEEYMLEQLVEYAKSLGANGLLNYQIHYKYPASMYGVSSQYSQATVSAFAIERKK